MTDITREKKRLLDIYAKRYCRLKDPALCEHKPCTCSIAAEYRAFVNKTIPRDFREFTIFDFHGRLSKESALNLKIAADAKRQVLNFCYGSDASVEKIVALGKTPKNQAKLDQRSVVAKRVLAGHNVVVYGESAREVTQRISQEGTRNLIKEKPLGRTFVASIITKDVIKTRLDNRYPQLLMANYEWIQFSSLQKAITTESDDLVHLESCEWLVVDDITDTLVAASIQQKAFMQPQIDAFFDSRLRSQYSTLLVFKFDVIQRMTEIEPAFGISIMKIINDKNTCLILLSQSENDR
jgi:hypothetical protein